MDEASGFGGFESEAAIKVATGPREEKIALDFMGQRDLQESSRRSKSGISFLKDALGEEVRIGFEKPAPKAPNATVLYQKLEAQGFRCAISGRELTPQTATLDHIKPRTDGGSDAIDNLQWVDDEVNRAKGTLELIQFAEMCQVVAWMEKTAPNG